MVSKIVLFLRVGISHGETQAGASEMGIKSLMKLLQVHCTSNPQGFVDRILIFFCFRQDAAPQAIKEVKLQSLAGRVIAIDASGDMYRFMVAVRHGEAAQHLSNAAGETTSHLQGFLYRTLRLYAKKHTQLI